MSENVMSTGLMVPLNRKITQEESEEWTEELWDQGSDVRINYEGTLAYTDIRGDEYGIRFGIASDFSLDAFQDLAQFGLTVEEDKARPYSCYWYNGADSDMDMMTLEEFLTMTRQS
jgi:hypothetical protein